MICCYCGRHIIVEKTSKAKRGNGQGTAYKRGKTWTVNVTVGWWSDDDGKLHQKRITKGGFAKKADALAYAQTLKKGPFAAPSITMEKLFTQWEEAYKSRCGASTMAGYKAAFKHYTLLHCRRIDTIKPAELQARIDACKNGKRTKQMMKVVAGLLWKYAMDNDLVQKNIASNLYTGNDQTTTREPFTDLEVKRIRQAMDTEPYASYVIVLCFTGFRPGELLALTKDAVHKTETGVIYLVGGGKTEAGTDRIVPVPPWLADVIQQRLADPVSKKYLFPDLETGKKLSHDDFREKHFAPMMERLGITGKVPYSARHTYSNLLKNISGDSGDKARLMGHTDYAFTQERYQSSALDDLVALTNQLV